MSMRDLPPTPAQAAMLEHERLTSRANDWLHSADAVLRRVMAQGEAGTLDSPSPILEASTLAVQMAHAAATLALAYEARASRISGLLTR